MKSFLRSKKVLAVFLCLVMTIAIVSTGKESDAATVTKVTMSGGKVVNGKMGFIIKGCTSSGKVVWTYKTSRQRQTELYSASMCVKGSFVYVIDNNKYIRLKKSNGKVVVKKKCRKMWDATMKVDADGNLYAIGYYDSVLVKINKKGTTLWTHSFPKEYYWAYKIKLKGNKVVVTFDGEKKGSVSVDAETGKSV